MNQRQKGRKPLLALAAALVLATLAPLVLTGKATGANGCGGSENESLSNSTQAAKSYNLGDNLYLQGDFESFYYGPYREIAAAYGANQGLTQRTALDATVFHRGQLSGRIDTTAAQSTSALFDTMPPPRVSPSKNYNLSVWIRSDLPAGVQSIRVWAQNVVRDPCASDSDCTPAAGGQCQNSRCKNRRMGKTLQRNNAGARLQLTSGGQHGWHRFSMNILASDLDPDAEALAIYLEAKDLAVGHVWFDDLELKEVHGTVLPTEILNGQGANPISTPKHPGPQRDEASWTYALPFFSSTPSPITINSYSSTNVFFGNTPVPLDLQPANAGATVSWTLINYAGHVVEKGTNVGGARIILGNKVSHFGYLELVADAGGAPKRISLARFKTKRSASPSFALGSGGTYHSLAQQELGSNWVHVGVSWKFLEDSTSKVWGKIDTLINAQKNAGQKQILALFKNPDRFSHPGTQGKRLMAAHHDDFRDWFENVVQTWGHAIDAYQPMNEPYPDLFKGPASEIVTIHRIVKEVVAKFDPSAKVIGPCLLPSEPSHQVLMDELLQLGIHNHLDGISIHTYGGLDNDKTFVNGINKLRSQLTTVGARSLPLFITEHGLSTKFGYLPHERVQAQHLARLYLLAAESDVTALAWFSMNPFSATDIFQRSFALVRSNSTTGRPPWQPRPAFAAGRTLTNTFGHSRFIRTLATASPSVHIQEYRTTDGTNKWIYALWERSETRRTIGLRLAPSANVLIRDIVGYETSKTLSPDGLLKVDLSADPLYLEVADRLQVYSQDALPTAAKTQKTPVQ